MSDSGENSSDEVDAAIARIERWFDARRYVEVVEFCSELIARFPTDYRLYYHRAQAKTLGGDGRGAIADMTSAIAQNSAEPALFYFRGLWELDEGDQHAAANDLQQAIEAEERLGTSYYVESARFARAIALLFLGDYRQAELECTHVRADLKTFAAGQQWTVDDVLSQAARGRRPQSR